MSQPDLFRTASKPWNAGRLIGPKAPLKPKHVWAIRQELKGGRRCRDLALFNCAIDSKLRACDLVRLRVSDVAPGGVLRARSTVIQQKTGRPVPFEITEPTRSSIEDWLKVRGARTDDWLFPSRTRPGRHMTTRQYAASISTAAASSLGARVALGRLRRARAVVAASPNNAFELSSRKGLGSELAASERTCADGLTLSERTFKCGLYSLGIGTTSASPRLKLQAWQYSTPSWVSKLSFWPQAGHLSISGSQVSGHQEIALTCQVARW